MNNRGQVLTLFVLLLPIFILVLILIVDISNLALNKLEMDNINKILVDYSLDKLNESNLENSIKELGNINDDKLDIIINLENDTVNITLYKELKGIITKTKIYNIESNFKGYYEDDKKIIKRIKGDENE